MDLHKLGTYSDPILDRQFEELFRYLARLRGEGSPVGVVEPRYIGDEYFDSTNNIWYKANGLTTADWQSFAEIVHGHTGDDVTYVDVVDATRRKIVTEGGIINTEELP